jgi:hypothetical protein
MLSSARAALSMVSVDKHPNNSRGAAPAQWEVESMVHPGCTAMVQSTPKIAWCLALA